VLIVRAAPPSSNEELIRPTPWPGICADESRRIERRWTDPRPTCRSRMLSAREGPLFALCCTCQRFGRWSDPMMRTLLPVARLPPLESAFSALVDTLGAVSALTRKATTESRIRALRFVGHPAVYSVPACRRDV